MTSAEFRRDRRVLREVGHALRDEATRLRQARSREVEALIAGGGVFDHERALERDSDLPPWIGEER